MKENDKPPVSRAEAAATSTAHARINVPLNLDNWRHLPEPVATELTWLHQYLLSEGLSWEEAEKIVGFDRSTIYRVLKGTYEGNWENVAAKVGSLRRTVALQAAVQKTVFVETPQAKQIFWILDYTLGKSGVSFLIGPGGVGKTFAVKEWLRRHNHGRAVLVEAYPVGGAKLMLRSIAHAVGVNKNYSIPQLIEAVERAFDSTRMIIVDEVQHYVPCDPRSRPVAIECLRRIHDTTGCALALIGTAAARAEMERSTNFYEQLIRRAGKPFYIVDKFTPADIRPIAAQFVPNPSDEFLNLLTAWANDAHMGRLGYVTELLGYASKLAAASKKRLTEEIILAAHRLREQRSRTPKLGSPAPGPVNIRSTTITTSAFGDRAVRGQ